MAIGTQVFQFQQETDYLVGMATVQPGSVIHLVTSENRLVNFASESIQLKDKEAAGDRLFKLTRGETIIEVKIES